LSNANEKLFLPTDTRVQVYPTVYKVVSFLGKTSSKIKIHKTTVSAVIGLYF
jgi:hypothetical protein